VKVEIGAASSVERTIARQPKSAVAEPDSVRETRGKIDPVVVATQSPRSAAQEASANFTV